MRARHEFELKDYQNCAAGIDTMIAPNTSRRVGFMVTCLVDMMRPRIGFAAIELLEKAGYEVFVPAAQTCCGQPGHNSGDRPSARKLAEKLLGEFENCEYLVSPSGSCSGMIKAHYEELFSDNPALAARAKKLGDKTYELTSFLYDIAKLEKIESKFSGDITYHDCCSGLREMKVKFQPRYYISQIPAAQIKEMSEPETCCGFGGTFSIKYGEISARLADAKCDMACATGAGTIVMGDLGCMLNVEGRLRRRGDHTTQVKHIAEVLTTK
jgi:L-lactate dehydrogenase complex protein LldE